MNRHPSPLADERGQTMLEKPSESDLPSAPSGSPVEPAPNQAPPVSPAEPPEEQAPPPPPANPFALAPVSTDEPCGPDLDLEGDGEFLNFIAATEGHFPTNFYAFQREAIDFPAALQTVDKLLKRTLDVRLLTLAAKLSVLNRDVAGFARFIGALAWLLREHWEGAHPRAEGGDYSLRLGQVMALEDNALVLLPLQYARLLELPREGAFSYRDQLAATGAVQPRTVTRYNEKGVKEISADEKFVAQKTIEKILRDVEIEKLAALVETLRGLAQSLESIRATTIEHVGYENGVELPKLDKLARDMAEFVRAALVTRDPTLAAPAGGAADEAAGEAAQTIAAPGAFASRAEVDAALAAAFGYFALSEPTSPAVLLIAQAREMLGKNLYEVMKLLTPPHADAARVFVGPDGAFTVPVKILAGAPSASFERAASEPAPSRAAALAQIDAVAQHMQRAEPSSPVPYLLDRARNLATRDFVSLLSDVLPDEAIANLKKGK
jgi:type VI secretion system protein ImpA